MRGYHYYLFLAMLVIRRLVIGNRYDSHEGMSFHYCMAEYYAFLYHVLVIPRSSVDKPAMRICSMIREYCMLLNCYYITCSSSPQDRKQLNQPCGYVV